jgi:hypothetical protein
VAKTQEEAFDVLTFYIYVMALLTAIVGGFALWNKKKVDAEAAKIRGELIKLDQMKRIAGDEELRGWIAREREGRQTVGSGSPADFQALYVQRSEQSQVRLTNHMSGGVRERPGGTEFTFSLQIEGCRVENLVKFLVGVEEEWPGARVSRITKLDWNERTELWDAAVELSIFRAAA